MGTMAAGWKESCAAPLWGRSGAGGPCEAPQAHPGCPGQLAGGLAKSANFCARTSPGVPETDGLAGEIVYGNQEGQELSNAI